MTSEELLKVLEPIMKLSMENHLFHKALQKHYIQTIGALTGKPEEAIQKELDDILVQVRDQVLSQAEKNGLFSYLKIKD